MTHLQNYAEQMGGFDFTYTQRYEQTEVETSNSKRKT